MPHLKTKLACHLIFEPLINAIKMDDNFPVQEVFESAVSIVRNLPEEGPIKPSNELKLKLYAFYKQATHGPNDTPKPRFYQIVEGYKWEAWLKLGEMTKEEAMTSYINKLKQIMETIPRDEADVQDSKHFEDILGKKFYDYWFNQWQQSETSVKQLATYSERDKESLQDAGLATKNNDTQSNSSGGSSMSMLEETQSAGDGYKTPSSLALKETLIGAEVSDQFALAILRLQHGLEETVVRLDTIEGQLKQSMIRIQMLENQTLAKESATTRKLDGVGRSDIPCRPKGIFELLRNMTTIHWFFLSYPFLVYIIISALKRRNRNVTR